jgi:hypothetical protein
MPIRQTSRRASDTKTEAEALDEDVDLTFDEEEAQAQFEDIPKVPEREFHMPLGRWQIPQEIRIPPIKNKNSSTRH